ncbi:MAG: multicopper oxidase family protein [Candidatus Limnocylindria bacterium]
MPKRSFLVITLLAGLAVGVAGTVAAYSLSGATKGPAAAAAVIDRAALEQVLAEAEIPPTGQTRRFDLVVQESPWELLPGVTTRAITFNGTVPGPTIRVTEGDAVEIEVTNKLDVSTSIHWHGLHVPNDEDGVAGITQEPIAPGETYAYRFTAPHAGTFMYHSHGEESRDQMDRGLYAPFIIDPQGGDPVAADREVILALGNWMIGDDMAEMDAMSMEYDYLTINGRSFPATESIDVTEGELVRLRFINPSQTIHPMHLHGTDMAVIAKDGEALPEPQRLSTLNIAQGETYDVVFRADQPGTWLLHCHDLHHASNAGVEPGGLIVAINVRSGGGEPAPADAPTPGPSEPAPSDVQMPTMDPDMPGMPGMSP